MASLGLLALMSSVASVSLIIGKSVVILSTYMPMSTSVFPFVVSVRQTQQSPPHDFGCTHGSQLVGTSLHKSAPHVSWDAFPEKTVRVATIIENEDISVHAFNAGEHEVWWFLDFGDQGFPVGGVSLQSSEHLWYLEAFRGYLDQQ